MRARMAALAAGVFVVLALAAPAQASQGIAAWPEVTYQVRTLEQAPLRVMNTGTEPLNVTVSSSAGWAKPRMGSLTLSAGEQRLIPVEISGKTARGKALVSFTFQHGANVVGGVAVVLTTALAPVRPNTPHIPWIVVGAILGAGAGGSLLLAIRRRRGTRKPKPSPVAWVPN